MEQQAAILDAAWAAPDPIPNHLVSTGLRGALEICQRDMRDGEDRQQHEEAEGGHHRRAAQTSADPDDGCRRDGHEEGHDPAVRAGEDPGG